MAYDFSADDSYSPEYHNVKVMMTILFLSGWIWRLGMRVIRYRELEIGLKNRNVVHIDNDRDLNVVLSRDLVVLFVEQQLHHVTLRCRKIPLSSHISGKVVLCYDHANFIDVLVTLDTIGPTFLCGWVGVSMNTFNAQVLKQNQASIPVYSEDARLPEFKRSLYSLTPISIAAGKGVSVSVRIPLAQFNEAIKQCNNMYPVVLYTCSGVQKEGSIDSLAPHGEITLIDYVNRDPSVLSSLSYGGLEELKYKSPNLKPSEILTMTKQYVTQPKQQEGHHLLEAFPTYGVWEQGDSIECMTCLENPRDIIFLPCRHMCVCHECKKQLTSCPICRSTVTSFQRFGKHADIELQNLSIPTSPSATNNTTQTTPMAT